jgi:hypothetical protein
MRWLARPPTSPRERSGLLALHRAAVAKAAKTSPRGEPASLRSRGTGTAGSPLPQAGGRHGAAASGPRSTGREAGGGEMDARVARRGGPTSDAAPCDERASHRTDPFLGPAVMKDNTTYVRPGNCKRGVKRLRAFPNVGVGPVPLCADMSARLDAIGPIRKGHRAIVSPTAIFDGSLLTTL